MRIEIMRDDTTPTSAHWIKVDGVRIAGGSIGRDELVPRLHRTILDIPGWTATKDPEPEPVWAVGYVVREPKGDEWIVISPYGKEDWKVAKGSGANSVLSDLQRPLTIVAEPQYRNEQ